MTMTRWVPLLLLAVLVTACASARAETPDLSAAVEGFTTATTTTVGAASEASPTLVVPSLPEGFHLPASAPIKRPVDFPSVAELKPMVVSGVQPYDRARITSCLSLIDGEELIVAEGFDTDRLAQAMKITYYDDLVIWEDPEGLRQIFHPDVGSFYEADDGNWQEATGFEWTVVGPLSDWSVAQSAAALVLDGDAEVVGYEMIADTPTVRLALIQGRDRADIWLDEGGAALRIVQDFTGGDGVSRWLGVWSVETLSPELTLQLPVSP